MNLLTVEKVTKTYTQRRVLDQADFSIQEGEKIGVIGVNGTGKTTLLKLITGLEEPDEGTISVGRLVSIRFLPQLPVLDPESTVLGAVLEQAQKNDELWDMEGQAKAVLTRLGMTRYEDKIMHLSGGQKKRVALAGILLSPADLLVLDEPTNHLDHDMVQWLEEYLISRKKAILMVTHDRYFLDRIATRIVELDQGKIYSYSGNYSEFLRLSEAREESDIASWRKKKSLLKTELEWLSRGVRGRGTKQKAHIARVMDLKEQKAPTAPAQVQMDSISTRMGNKTIEAVDICKSYNDRILIDHFSYLFLKKDRIGIIGSNGCGKSTLLKILAGKLSGDSGTVEIGQTVSIGYFSQENEYMDPSLKVIEYIRQFGERIKTDEGEFSAAQLLERFLFDKVLQWQEISNLSGGEQRRLYLLGILIQAPNVLLLDEPTNDLDIQTLQILEDYLDHFAGIVVSVSHDRYFLDRAARRMFAFEENGTIRQYEGGFTDYYLKKEAEKTADKPKQKEKVKEVKEARPRRPQKLKFTYNEEREYAVIEEEIADLEERIAALEEKMEDAASQYSKLELLIKEKEDEEAMLEAKMLRWEYLQELADRIEAERGDTFE